MRRPAGQNWQFGPVGLRGRRFLKNVAGWPFHYIFHYFGRFLAVYRFMCMKIFLELKIFRFSNFL